MSLEILLTKLESHNVTPVTGDKITPVTLKTVESLGCTSVTSVTAEFTTTEVEGDIYTKISFSRLEERIAIIQHESDLPEAWAEAFARLDYMDCPTSISQATWQHIINNTSLLLDNYINDIITHGWSIADIFGVHKNKPEGRYNCMGLLILLGNNEVIAVTADKITMQASNGKPQGFYRTNFSNSAERIMIWELI